VNGIVPIEPVDDQKPGGNRAGSIPEEVHAVCLGNRWIYILSENEIAVSICSIAVPTWHNGVVAAGGVENAPVDGGIQAAGGVAPAPANGGSKATGGVALAPANGGMRAAGGVAYTPANGGSIAAGGVQPPPADGGISAAGGVSLAPADDAIVAAGNLVVCRARRLQIHCVQPTLVPSPSLNAPRGRTRPRWIEAERLLVIGYYYNRIIVC